MKNTLIVIKSFVLYKNEGMTVKAKVGDLIEIEVKGENNLPAVIGLNDYFTFPTFFERDFIVNHCNVYRKNKTIDDCKPLYLGHLFYCIMPNFFGYRKPTLVAFSENLARYKSFWFSDESKAVDFYNELLKDKSNEKQNEDGRN